MHLVVGALLVRDGRVLLAHRSTAKQWYPNVWDLVGGHVEAGETPVDALRREVQEELGVTIGDVGDPIGRVSDLAAPDGGLDITVWAVRTWTGEPANCAPEEHDDLRWYTRDEAPALQLAHGSLDPLIDRALR